MKGFLLVGIVLVQFGSAMRPILPNGQIQGPSQIGNPWAVGSPGNPVYVRPVYPRYYGAAPVEPMEPELPSLPSLPSLGDDEE